MIKEPYNFTENDLFKYGGVEKKTSDSKDKLGIPKNIDVDSKIKDYTVIDLIGEGSYSSVWNVYNKDKNNIYAIKMTKPNNDDEKVAQNEISILKKLNNNEYIIKLHNSFYYKNNNDKYLCMCFDKLGCDLHVLKRLFKYKNDYYNDSDNSSEVSFHDPIIALPFKLSKKIVYQILKGLDYMHDNNIIHTDLKLDNILINKNVLDIKSDEDINIKICDFGTAHYTTDKCNFNVGTIDYSAPECIIGLPYGCGIDIWATGCILFEILTGVCLFDYTRYYLDADTDESSGYSSSSYDNENDKTQIEFLVLCMMKKILGEFPGKVFKKGKYYENYFDYKGRLRFKALFLDEDSILDTLVDDFNFDENVSEEINTFISKMLSIDPDKRSNVKQLLEDSWLNDKCD
jgi:serine/threonine-protein kinase SRPK3